MSKTHHEWWREAVIYQIYPRSFKDSNADGIGDLAGITQKLDYLENLGIDGIWISPFFKSPMKDFGYDVSNYRDVDPIFGTLGDFDHLIEQAQKRDLKIIIDLVLSHTSNQHPWFQDPNKKDWYVWADAKEDGSPPNNWVSVFGGSAWKWDEHYEQYYLHNFLEEQPDLNFHNPAVQKEMLETCKFWLDRGVDGFRLDVVNFYFHDLELKDNPPRHKDLGYATQLEKDTPYSAQAHVHDKSQPENINFIKQLRTLTDEYEDCILIGEIGDDHPYKLAQEYTQSGMLHTTYNPHMMSGTNKKLTENIIRKPIEAFFKTPSGLESGWPAWAFSNHDVVRATSRWHKEFDYHPDFSKMLIALLGCLPGTLFLYQGEELGLPEAKIPFSELQDPWAKETWPEWQGRDGCRTPMVWTNDSPYFGFSESKPWLPIPSTHHALNIQQQQQKQNTYSILHFTSAFLKWRKLQNGFSNIKTEFIDTSHSNIIHILKTQGEFKTNCIFNLSNNEISYQEQKLEAYYFRIDRFNHERA